MSHSLKRNSENRKVIYGSQIYSKIFAVAICKCRLISIFYFSKIMVRYGHWILRDWLYVMLSFEVYISYLIYFPITIFHNLGVMQLVSYIFSSWHLKVENVLFYLECPWFLIFYCPNNQYVFSKLGFHLSIYLVNKILWLFQ